jgi:hypothetical protein
VPWRAVHTHPTPVRQCSREIELLALPWGSEGLDLDAGIVRVRRSVDRVRDATGQYPFVPPKSRASRRDVPLASEDVARLRRHRLASGRPPDGALVFGNEEGEPHTRSRPASRPTPWPPCSGKPTPRSSGAATGSALPDEVEGDALEGPGGGCT